VDIQPPASAGPSYLSGWRPTPPEEYSLENDPNSGWSGSPLIVKGTQGQKKALKKARRVAAGIPPNGHKKPVSKFTPVASTKPRKVRDADDNGDSTDSVSSSDDETFTVDKSTVDKDRFPLDEGQTTDTSALGNSPETPISQLSSLASNNETTLLSSAPDYEREEPVPTTPEDVRRMIVDVNLPESSSSLDESHISSLSLDDTHIPDDPTK
jgi:hypothetical protein